MKFKHTLAMMLVAATIQLPCITHAAEEDRELALIAAEQANDDDEQLNKINPALTDTITAKPKQETDKDIKERKKKLKQTRKEKEKLNEQRLKASTAKRDTSRREQPVIIEPTPQSQPQPVSEPTPHPQPQPVSEPTPQPQPQPVSEPTPQPQPQPVSEPTPQPQPQPVVEPVTPQPQPQPVSEPAPPPSPLLSVETVRLPDQKLIYANFVEVARAVHFVPLYVPRKSGYEITAIYAGQGIVEIRYGRRWEPTVSLAVRTYKRADGEELQDISGVTGVKWRVDTTTGTTIYIAKISDTEQVAAWAVGHYTFSARSENLSFAGFHSLVADELVELSTHYYVDL